MGSSVGDNTLEGIAYDLQKRFQNGTLDRLTPTACIDQYAVNLQISRRKLILVSNDTRTLAGPRIYNNYNSAVHPGTIRCASDPFDWICSQNGVTACLDGTTKVCPVAYKSIVRANWTPLGNKIEYCLSETVTQTCKLHFATSIAWTVIAFNASKVVILIGIFLFVRENPLATMGDAVSSFLQRKDETTSGLCLMSRDQIALWRMPPIPQPYTIGVGRKSRKWSNVVSKYRWWFCMWL